MAANALVELALTLTGLGTRHDPTFSFNIGTTPTSVTYNYRTLASAGTAEALDLGDVSTVYGILIKAVDSDIELDCNFSSSFSADLKIKSGEVAFFMPAGSVYVQNEDSGETPSYEYYVIGTT